MGDFSEPGKVHFDLLSDLASPKRLPWSVSGSPCLIVFGELEKRVKEHVKINICDISRIQEPMKRITLCRDKWS